MTVAHHPPDDLMLSLAAGSLRPAMALVLQVHAEGCATCRARLAGLEAIGGALLEDSDPVALAPDALARTLERLSRPDGLVSHGTHEAGRTRSRSSDALSMPPGVTWPAGLRRCELTRWRRMAPGMRWARATLPEDPEVPLFLLRIAPGSSLARHTHGQVEFTQVLCGSFDDGRAVFGPGDFDVADAQVHHQPQVLAGAECVCLAYVEDGLRYDSRLAGLVGRWIGL